MYNIACDAHLAVASRHGHTDPTGQALLAAATSNLATSSADPSVNWATNYVDIHFPLLLWTHLLAFVLCTACVALRLYIRRVIVKQIAMDDWLLIAAYIAFLSYVFFDIAFGTEIQIHGLEDVYWLTFMLSSYWEIPFWLASVLVRAPIAAFFLRALPKYKYRWQRRTIIGLVGIYALFMTVVTFVNVYQCGNPLDWETSAGPTCLNYTAMAVLPVVSRAFTMVLDWLMTILPVRIVWKSAMARRSKISAASILILAGGGSTVSVLRMVYNYYGAMGGPLNYPGFTIWMILALWENAAAIIVVSLAAMRPLVEKLSNRNKSAHSDAVGEAVVYVATMDQGQSLDHGEEAKKNNIVFLGESELR